jgi:hypothetical protein
MNIVNDRLVTDDQEEAAQIIKNLGLETFYQKGSGIVMGMLRADIFADGHDYPVIWNSDNGAFKMYDDICIVSDKYILSFIGINSHYAKSYDDLKIRIDILMKEMLKILNNSIEKIIDKNLE